MIVKRPRYKPTGVRFDGVNDWLTRDGGLTSAADSKLVTFTVLFKKQGADAVGERILGTYDTLAGGSAARQFSLTKTGGNVLQVVGENAAGTTILSISTGAVATVAAGLVQWTCSFDLSDTGKRHSYVNGVSDLTTITTYTDDTLDFTGADFSIGADANGNAKFDADIAYIALWFGVYVDLSTNLNRFWLGGKPRDIGSGGRYVGLGQASVCVRPPSASFATNEGVGGGFTTHGALTDSGYL